MTGMDNFLVFVGQLQWGVVSLSNIKLCVILPMRRRISDVFKFLCTPTELAIVRSSNIFFWCETSYDRCSKHALFHSLQNFKNIQKYSVLHVVLMSNLTKLFTQH